MEWLKFRSGSTSREEGGNVHQVVNFTCHEKFTLDSLDYDVAVAFVKDKFDYKDNSVMPAILNTEMIKDGMAVTATGWGYKQVWQRINQKWYYQLAGLINLASFYEKLRFWMPRVVSEDLNFMIYNLEILACFVHVYKISKLMK